MKKSRYHALLNDEIFRATVSFYGELNDFFIGVRCNQGPCYLFTGKPSVKDVIESRGVPHTEVEMIMVNGQSQGFDYHVKNGDTIKVYPITYQLEGGSPVKLREPIPGDPRFILDVHLGKLARFMRLMGFDSLYRNDYDDEEIAQLSSEQHRAVLTRDCRMLYRRIITHGYWLRSQNADEQLEEVLRRFNLKDRIRPFCRCLTCNGRLVPVDKYMIIDSLEPKTQKYYATFRQCSACGKIFWQGSHTEKLTDIVARHCEG